MNLILRQVGFASPLDVRKALDNCNNRRPKKSFKAFGRTDKSAVKDFIIQSLRRDGRLAASEIKNATGINANLAGRLISELIDEGNDIKLKKTCGIRVYVI